MRRHTFAIVRPEYELILLCSRIRLSNETAARIDELIANGLDWSCVVETALTHKVALLLYRNLTALSLASLPQEWMRALRTHYERNARRNIYLTGQLLRLLDEFRAEGIRAIPYKGPVLAALVYGDLTLREFDDLDWMLPHRQIASARRRLIAAGFEPESPTEVEPAAAHAVPGQYSFHKDGGRCNVELHTERTLRYYPKHLEVDDLFARCIPVSLAGGSAPSIAPESLLMVLGVHGSKHLWDRLSWICDFAELLQLECDVAWNAAIDQSRRLGCERMLLLGCALANELLDADLPEPFAARLREVPKIGSLSRRLASTLFSEERHVPGLAERFLFRLRTAQGLGQGLRHCYILAKSPTEEDRNWAPWAQAAAPAYALLRPLRLLRKYGTGLLARRVPQSSAQAFQSRYRP